MVTDYLILDISNLLYRTYFVNRDEDEATLSGLAMTAAFNTILKYYRLFTPTKRIIMCFDRPNWRLDFTKSDKSISKKRYKGNRRKDMTIKERQKYENFLEHISSFEELIKDHTSIVCLAKEKLEADDLVAGFVQKYNKNKCTIISTDKDFMQLLRNKNVTLINPADGKPRTLSVDWEGNADYFMFTKNFRGDAGDNVQSAYPRIRQTKIKKAYDDPILCLNIMNESWTNHEGREIFVKDMFKENEILMDLRKQPSKIRKIIDDTITEEMLNPGTYSYFHFMGFLGKNNMKKLSKNSTQYVKMLSQN